MTQPMVQLQEAAIKAQCKQLRMPVMAAQFRSVAEQAVREKKSHIGYLEALLGAELEERERNTIARRIKDAHLPRVKTLEEFDYAQSPNVSAAKMRELAETLTHLPRNDIPSGILSSNVTFLRATYFVPAVCDDRANQFFEKSCIRPMRL